MTRYTMQVELELLVEEDAPMSTAHEVMQYAIEHTSLEGYTLLSETVEEK